MKYISRITALLLALMMLTPTFASAITVGTATQSDLDKLYQAASSDETVYINAGLLGDWSELSAFGTLADKELYTFQWYDQSGKMLACYEEPTVVRVANTMEEQEFYCVATDATGNQLTSPTFVLSAADISDVEAYLDLLYDYRFLDALSVVDTLSIYGLMTDTWDITLADGSNLAESILSLWWSERDYEGFDPYLLCSCVITGAVESDDCVLHPNSNLHTDGCCWKQEEMTADVDVSTPESLLTTATVTLAAVAHEDADYYCWQKYIVDTDNAGMRWEVIDYILNSNLYTIPVDKTSIQTAYRVVVTTENNVFESKPFYLGGYDFYNWIQTTDGIQEWMADDSVTLADVVAKYNAVSDEEDRVNAEDYTYGEEGESVNLKVPQGTFAEDYVMEIEPVAAERVTELQKTVMALMDATGTHASQMLMALDISFASLADRANKLQPDAPVALTFEVDTTGIDEALKYLYVFHIADNGTPEVVAGPIEAAFGVQTIAVKAEAFSEYLVMATNDGCPYCLNHEYCVYSYLSAFNSEGQYSELSTAGTEQSYWFYDTTLEAVIADYKNHIAAGETPVLCTCALMDEEWELIAPGDDQHTEDCLWHGNVLRVIGLYGNQGDITVDTAIYDVNNYTYKWFCGDDEIVGATDYWLTVDFTMETVTYYWEATPNNGGETFKSAPIQVTAQWTSLGEYIDYALQYHETNEDLYSYLTDTLNVDYTVVVDEGEVDKNLADEVMAFWYDKCLADPEYYYAGIFCTCVVSGAVTSDECMLPPDALHAADCPWHKTTYTDDKYGISVTGNIPQDVTLQISPVTLTDEQYDEFSIDNPEILVAAYDITLQYDDGTVWQPDAGNNVTITFDAAMLGMSDGLEYQVRHQHETDVTISDVAVVTDGTLTFVTDSFSVFAVTGLWGVNANLGTPVTMYVGDVMYFKCDTDHGQYSHSWQVQNNNNRVTIASYTKPDGTDGSNAYVGVTATRVGEVTLYCNNTNNSVTITIVEKPIDNSTLKIEDHIYTNGCLVPVLDSAIDASAGVVYKWYKNSKLDGSGDYVEVTGEALSNTYVAADAANGVNVAVDQGGKCWYKVVATLADGTTYESVPYWVPYSNELENGGFETPNITNYNPFTGWGAGNVQFNQEDSRYTTTAQNVLNGTALWWRTTGPGSGNAVGRDIEIVRPGNATLNGSYYVTPAEENQYAELNCETVGTLYQDVLTSPNSTLSWSFSHLGRDGEDTMAVVVMPAAQADEWAEKLANETTEDGINSLLDQIAKIPGAQVWRPLTASEEGTDRSPDWTVHSGTYKTVEGQYLSRFFFVSVVTTGSSLTMGNFIDGVSFDDKINYTIRYYVDGELKSAYTETGKVKPFTTVSASHTAQFSAYALDKVEKAGNGYAENWGSTSMRVDENDIYMDIFYVSTGISITKKIVVTDPQGYLTANELAASEEEIWQQFGSAVFELRDSNNRKVAEATVAVNATTGEGVALFMNNGQKYKPEHNKTYTIVEKSTHTFADFEWSQQTDVQITIPDNTLAGSIEYTNTYIAKQRHSTLTIEKKNMQAGESAIVQVVANGQTYTIVFNEDNLSATIADLPIGSEYTVTELTDWSWRYSNQPTIEYTDAPEGTVYKIDANAELNKVTITNTRGTDKWLSDESAVENNLGNGNQDELNNQ